MGQNPQNGNAETSPRSFENIFDFGFNYYPQRTDSHVPGVRGLPDALFENLWKFIPGATWRNAALQRKKLAGFSLGVKHGGQSVCDSGRSEAL
jgi:hypothetical protein